MLFSIMPEQLYKGRAAASEYGEGWGGPGALETPGVQSTLKFSKVTLKNV